MADNNSVSQFIEALKADNGNDKLLENLLPQQKEEVKQPEEEQVEEEKEVPFNQNPKVKRYIEKEVKKALSQMTPQAQEDIQDSDELKDLVDAFTKVVGNDKPENSALVEKFGKALEGFRDKAMKAEELVESQNQEVQQE